MRPACLRANLAGRRFSQSAVRRIDPFLQYYGQQYPWFWLRDSCQCPSCLHPSTRQKLHRTSDIPAEVQPVDSPEGVRVKWEGVDVKWDSGHESFYPREFLERYASRKTLREFHRDLMRLDWDVKTLRESASSLYLPYDALKTPKGLHSGMTQLSQYGLLFVTGVPTEKTSNEECELRALGERFGELRKTFYGETWDVKAIQNSRNIAYTNVDLGLHMDLLYFQHPPRYQILHCLRNRVEGGTSVFVDAVHVASKLRKEDRAAFDVLAGTPVAFHYINDGHHLYRVHRTIQLAEIGPRRTAPIAFINYSPPFQAPLPQQTPLPQFVPALKKFADMLEDPEVRFEYLLKEGDAVIFDNRRVLHARTAFREREAESSEEETHRWFKGCYLEADPVLDRLRVLGEQLEKSEAAKQEEEA
ncbi:Clavaminate synthase-like protein [Ganoderma leucocontextum]|nr:Clavaminate synthase-like protein [Ganoderma leucocontextum]